MRHATALALLSLLIPLAGCLGGGPTGSCPAGRVLPPNAATEPALTGDLDAVAAEVARRLGTTVEGRHPIDDQTFPDVEWSVPHGVLAAGRTNDAEPRDVEAPEGVADARVRWNLQEDHAETPDQAWWNATVARLAAALDFDEERIEWHGLEDPPTQGVGEGRWSLELLGPGAPRMRVLTARVHEAFNGEGWTLDVLYRPPLLLPQGATYDGMERAAEATIASCLGEAPSDLQFVHQDISVFEGRSAVRFGAYYPRVGDERCYWGTATVVIDLETHDVLHARASC